MSAIAAALEGITLLGLDTAPIIYFVEQHPSYFPLANAVFARFAQSTSWGYCSAITLTEVLVHPKRTGDRALERTYRLLLLESRNLSLIPVSPLIAERAAELRARYRLLTPDAIQIATALQQGCQTFLTNDLTLRRVTELRVLALEELAG